MEIVHLSYFFYFRIKSDVMFCLSAQTAIFHHAVMLSDLCAHTDTLTPTVSVCYESSVG